MALPCSTHCQYFFDGCHKDCAYWAFHRMEIKEKSAKIRAYMRDNQERTGAILHQLNAISRGR